MHLLFYYITYVTFTQSRQERQALLAGELTAEKGAKIKIVTFYKVDLKLICQARRKIDETAGRQSGRMSPQAREHHWGNSYPPKPHMRLW